MKQQPNVPAQQEHHQGDYSRQTSNTPQSFKPAMSSRSGRKKSSGANPTSSQGGAAYSGPTFSLLSYAVIVEQPPSEQHDESSVANSEPEKRNDLPLETRHALDYNYRRDPSQTYFKI